MGIFYNDCMSRNFAKPVFDPLNYFVLIIIPSVKILSFLFIICAFLVLTFLLILLSFDHQALCMLLVDWLKRYLQF